MSKETLKLALEALRPISHNNTDDPRGQADKAIKALEEALAKQEQGEPFGWYDMEHGEIRDVEWNRLKPTYEGVWRPLYTTPQQRKPLTVEQIEALRDKYLYSVQGVIQGHAEHARAIEAAHGIKE